jgi:hypothetical protein
VVIALLIQLELCATVISSVKLEIQLKLLTQWALASHPNAKLLKIVTLTPKPVTQILEFASVSHVM